MEIRNVLERLKLLTNDDREDLLLMLSGDAVQRLKARLCCTLWRKKMRMRRRCAQRLRRRRRISFGFWRKRHRRKA